MSNLQSRPPAPDPAAQAPFLRIDAMRLADVPLVARLEILCFTSPWSETAYRHELTANPRSFYFVIRPPAELSLDEETSTQSQPPTLPPTLPPILGYGGYWLLGDEAHIVTIASHPQYRRKALGELMLLHLIGCAREGQANAVTLEVRVGNIPAKALYAKWGFAEVGLRKRYYRDNNEDALLMTLHNADRDTTWAPMAQRIADLLTLLDGPMLEA
ncbi:MAG: ribosomal protein S18-alanine N-acetyltransferase [Caldilineaceae bacterium]